MSCHYGHQLTSLETQSQCSQTFVTPFLPTRLISPRSARMPTGFALTAMACIPETGDRLHKIMYRNRVSCTKKPEGFVWRLLNWWLHFNLCWGRFTTHYLGMLTQVKLFTSPKKSNKDKTVFIRVKVSSSLRKQTTSPMVSPRTDIGEMSQEIPYWQHVTTRIWVVLLIA